MKNVVVLFGGISVEHDISVITGVMTANALKEKFNVIPVYIGKDGIWRTGDFFDIENVKELTREKKVVFIQNDNNIYIKHKNKLKKYCAISAVINCMHGGSGEGGGINGIFSSIPYVSPDILPSALFMDKIATKYFLRGIGVKTLPFVQLNTAKDLLVAQKKWGYPLIIKPVDLGSSIGITKVENYEEGVIALSKARRYSNKIMAEKCLQNFIEINCAVYKNNEIVVSECERPIGKKEVLSFYDKYDSCEREFPANIPSELSNKIKSITKKVYQKSNLNGIVRMDFMICDDKIYLNEVNTIPGSLAYYLFFDTLKEFANMLEEQINLVIQKFSQDCTLNRDFASQVLSFRGSKGLKRL